MMHIYSVCQVDALPFRVSCCGSDGHFCCVCTEQLEDEIVGVLDLVEKILKRFGFKNIEVMLSTRPPDSVGKNDQNFS
jgi:threonyl-tRNA synthetase